MQRLSTTGLIALLCTGCGVNDVPATDPAIPARTIDHPAEAPAAVAVLPTDTIVGSPVPNPIYEPAPKRAAAESEVASTSLPPSPLEGDSETSVIEPRSVPVPGPGADASAVATYVAEVWGNTGPGIAPWHDEAASYLTPLFRASLEGYDHDVARRPARATALVVETGGESAARRVAVTLEQELGSADVPWRVLTLDLLVIVIDSRWLVASLEVVG